MLKDIAYPFPCGSMNREWLLKKTQIEKKGVAWRRSIKNVFLIFFSVRIFFHGHWQLTGQHEKGRDHVLFHSATSTCSRTFRHLFATLHVRLLVLYLPDCHSMRFTGVWNYHLIDWYCDVSFFVCLLDDLVLVLQPFETGNRWTLVLHKQTD